MGPGEAGGDFVVEESEPAVYNVTGAQPPIWQPAPADILLMFQQLETNQALPLKWVCPGRRPPDRDPPEMPADVSDGEDEEDNKDEEKSAPVPSAFDFDDTASEASAKVKLTPRTPVTAKAKQKKVASMDNILGSLKRSAKAERQARKSLGRGQPGAPGTPLRPGAGAVPSRLGASPRLPAPSASPSASPLPTGATTTTNAPAAPSASPAQASRSQPGSPAPRLSGSPAPRLSSETKQVPSPLAGGRTSTPPAGGATPRDVLPPVSSATVPAAASPKPSPSAAASNQPSQEQQAEKPPADSAK